MAKPTDITTLLAYAVAPLIHVFAIGGLDVDYPASSAERWGTPIEDGIDLNYPVEWRVDLERGSNEGHFISLVMVQEDKEHVAVSIRSHEEDAERFSRLIAELEAHLAKGVPGVLSGFSLAA